MAKCRAYWHSVGILLGLNQSAGTCATVASKIARCSLLSILGGLIRAITSTLEISCRLVSMASREVCAMVILYSFERYYEPVALIFGRGRSGGIVTKLRNCHLRSPSPLHCNIFTPPDPGQLYRNEQVVTAM